MSEDRSKPPSGYEVEKEWDVIGEMYLPRIPCPDFPRGEAEAIAACWEHHDRVANNVHPRYTEACREAFTRGRNAGIAFTVDAFAAHDPKRDREQQAIGRRKALNDVVLRVKEHNEEGEASTWIGIWALAELGDMDAEKVRRGDA